MIDELIEKIKEKNNPTALGLDTRLEYLPEFMVRQVKSLKDAGKVIFDFNAAILEKTHKIVPAVKLQSAYYEMYGPTGVTAFKETADAARALGLVTIGDVKRNDIGSTAECYAEAYLGATPVGGYRFKAFDVDFLTINPYLGSDGILPFTDRCKQYNKGIFVLCRTSNPSSAEFQSLISGERPLYEIVGDLIEQWGADSLGAYGYSRVGAVVGATHPGEARILRERLAHTFFLVPGYGAQGGGGDSAAVCFDGRGSGAIVNNSRGILTAHKNEKYKGLRFDQAAAAAAEDMQKDLNTALAKRRKEEKQ